MKPCPDALGDAQVILFTPIDERHNYTGNCNQIILGQLAGPMSGLAICGPKADSGFYLFGCDHDWNTVTDTWHATIEEAIEQAEFEYTGTKDTWTKK